MPEYNTWKRQKDLENTKEVVAEFEEKLSVKVRRQEKLNLVEEQNFRKKM